MADVKDEDIPDVYSQEEINAAREELKNMLPEDLLALRGDLERAQANQVIPEAVAICFTEVYSSKGSRVNITCRGMTGRHAIDELADTLRYAREKYGMQPSHPQPASVQPPDSREARYVQDELEHPETSAQSTVTGTTVVVPPPANYVVDIDVSGITRERKKDGTDDFLRVRGGMYTRFGVAAYRQVWPANFNINNLQYGVESNQVPAEMKHAHVDSRKPGVKVIQFFQ